MLGQRKCAGCGKSGSVWLMQRAYWHRACFDKAEPDARVAAEGVRNPTEAVEPRAEPIRRDQ